MSELKEKLVYEKTNTFKDLTSEQLKVVMEYSEGYKKFLNSSKTEREAVETSTILARDAGFIEYHLGDNIKVNQGYYMNNRGKNFFAFKIGEENLEKDGIRILAAHIDSPRLDLKQVPFYEDSEMCLLKTHYYGGIRKYQWTAIPLALHGVVILRDGTKLTISVGEKEDDPIFYISDLLPHLAAQQSQKPLSEAITAESLNVIIGGMPVSGEDSNAIKLNVLKILNDTYGLVEEDFLSAEICAVPALKAKDVGFDRAFIASYGHDDRVCSYPALTSLLNTKDNKHSVIVILADKEEIGSEGNTGMQCQLLSDLIDEIAKNFNKNPSIIRSTSMCLSADVNAAYDPDYKEVFEKANSSMISCGTVISKFTGARGKSGSNDASAEFLGKIRKIFNDQHVAWQCAELGKVDAGGGGTVAKYIAKLNIDTVDIGVAVLSMHAPYELISKADLYSTYEAFASFIRA